MLAPDVDESPTLGTLVVAEVRMLLLLAKLGRSLLLLLMWPARRREAVRVHAAKKWEGDKQTNKLIRRWGFR